MAIIQFDNGTKVNFDGDPTPQDVEEVAKNLGFRGGDGPSVAKSSQPTVPTLIPNPSPTGFIKNAASDALSTAEGIAKATLLNPDTKEGLIPIVGPLYDTAKNVANLGAGVLENVANAVNLKPGAPTITTPESQQATATGQHYNDAYGISDLIHGHVMDAVTKILNSIYTKPVTSAMDASAIADAGGALLGKAGVTGAADAAKTAAEAVNPITKAVSTAGKAAEGATEGKTIAPFANAFDTNAEQAAARQGVKLPASAMTKSDAVPLIETSVSKGLFGNGMEAKIDAAAERMNQVADNVIRSTGGVSDPVKAGGMIQRGIQAFKDNFTTTKNELYNEARIPRLDSTGKTVYADATGEALHNIKPAKTIDFLNTVIADKKAAAGVLGASPDLKFFENLKDNLAKGQDASTLQTTLRELNTRVKNFNDPISTGNQAVLRRVGATLSDELDSAVKTARPDLANAIDKANSYYKAGIEKLQSQFSQKIARLSSQPDKIAKTIITPSTSVEDVPRIFTTVGPEATNAIRGTFLEQMFKGARNSDGNFTPTGLSRQLTKFGDDKVRAVLTPEQYSTVKDLETLSRSLGRAQKISSGSQTAFIGRMVGEMVSLGLKPMLALKAVMSDAAISKFVSSDVGQQILGKGYKFTGETGRSIQSAAPTIGRVANVPRTIQSVSSQQPPQEQSNQE